MSIPQLTSFPDPPRIYQPEEEFDSKADEMAGHLPILVNEINAMVAGSNAAWADINIKTSTATNAATTASNAAAAAAVSASNAELFKQAAASSANAASSAAQAAAGSAAQAAASANSIDNATAAEISNGNVLKQVTANALKSALQDGLVYSAKFSGVSIGSGGGGINTNAAVGMQALYSNTAGERNTAIGMQALYSNTTGNSNTASGVQALYLNTTGNSNTASGVQALYLNTTGNSNTASGVQALYLNTTGNYNTASGMQALYLNTAGERNTASGMQALYSNTTGNYNTASGMYALYLNTAGERNTASGMYALYSNTTGNYNTAIGMYAGLAGSYSNAIHIGYEAQATADNECKIGNSSLTAIRSIATFHGAAFATTSDAKLKYDIVDVDLDKALLLAKRVKWHCYTKRVGAGIRQEAGVIAQELQALTTEIAAFEWLVQQSEDYLTVDYTSLYAILERANQYRFELLEGVKNGH